MAPNTPNVTAIGGALVMANAHTPPDISNVRAIDDVLVVCAWCPELHILRRPTLPAGSWLHIRIHGKTVIASIVVMWGDDETSLPISHGICAACKAVHFPEKPNSEAAGA